VISTNLTTTLVSHVQAVNQIGGQCQRIISIPRLQTSAFTIFSITASNVSFFLHVCTPSKPCNVSRQTLDQQLFNQFPHPVALLNATLYILQEDIIIVNTHAAKTMKWEWDKQRLQTEHKDIITTCARTPRLFFMDCSMVASNSLYDVSATTFYTTQYNQLVCLNLTLSSTSLSQSHHSLNQSHHSLSQSHSQSLSISLSVHLNLTLNLISLSQSHSQPVSVSLSVCLNLTINLSQSHSQSISISLSARPVCVNLTLGLCQSHSESVSISLTVHLNLTLSSTSLSQSHSQPESISLSVCPNLTISSTSLPQSHSQSVSISLSVCLNLTTVCLSLTISSTSLSQSHHSLSQSHYQLDQSVSISPQSVSKSLSARPVCVNLTLSLCQSHSQLDQSVSISLSVCPHSANTSTLTSPATQIWWVPNIMKWVMTLPMPP